MWSSRAVVLALILTAILAACGDLPQPFAPDAKPSAADDPLRLADGAGIAIQAPEGIGAAAPALAEAVVAALERHEIPVTTQGGNRGSLRLAGELRGSGETAVLYWTLSTADGAPLGGFEQPGGALLADAADLATLAEAVATKVSHFLDDDAATPPRPRVTFVVPPVIGAPGDGATALSRAMAQALEKAGAGLADEVGDDTLLLLGSVALNEAAPGSQHVEVVWEVVEADGRRLGVVSQANTIRAGELDGPWGKTAEAIAADGAEGVLDLLARTGRQ